MGCHSIKHCMTMTNPTEGEKADRGVKDPKHFKSLERRVECQRMGATAAGAVAAPWKCKAAVLVERSISMCGYAKPAAAGAAVFSPKQRILLKNFPACGNSRKRKHNNPGESRNKWAMGKPSNNNYNNSNAKCLESYTPMQHYKLILQPSFPNAPKNPEPPKNPCTTEEDPRQGVLVRQQMSSFSQLSSLLQTSKKRQ
jgi:hypothetical protein